MDLSTYQSSQVFRINYLFGYLSFQALSKATSQVEIVQVNILTCQSHPKKQIVIDTSKLKPFGYNLQYSETVRKLNKYFAKDILLNMVIINA